MLYFQTNHIHKRQSLPLFMTILTEVHLVIMKGKIDWFNSPLTSRSLSLHQTD